MPFKSRRHLTKRRHRRRRFRKRKPLKYTKFARRVSKVIAVTAEKKYNDIVSSTDSLVNSAAFTANCNTIIQGVDFNQRIGQSISGQLLVMRLAVNSAQSTPNPALFRVLIIYYRETTESGAMPVSPVDLLPTLPNAVFKYYVLYDHTFPINLGIQQRKLMIIKIPLHSLPDTKFDLNTNDHREGLIQLRVITDNSVADAYEVAVNFRYYYIDT